MDDIFLTGNDLTAREEFCFHRVDQARERIFQSCGKCDHGFIEKRDHDNLLDIVNEVAIECDCYKKALMVSERIVSGVIEKYAVLDEIKFKADSNSVKLIKKYIDKIDEAKLDGIGILLCNHENQTDDFDYAKLFASYKILFSALEKKYSAHYITAGEYIELYKSTMNQKDDGSAELLNEINDVDFLFLDFMNFRFSTNFVADKMRGIVYDRIMKGRPIVLITKMTKKKIVEVFTESIAKIIFSGTVEIIISKFAK